MQCSSLLHLKFVVKVLSFLFKSFDIVMYFWNIFLSQFDFSMPFKMYHLDINVKLYGLLPVDEDT